MDLSFITFNTDATAAGKATADIVEELPEVGTAYGNFIVQEIAPFPLDNQPEQEDPSVYQYSIWKMRFHNGLYWYVAIHEPESETM